MWRRPHRWNPGLRIFPLSLIEDVVGEEEHTLATIWSAGTVYHRQCWSRFDSGDAGLPRNTGHWSDPSDVEGDGFMWFGGSLALVISSTTTLWLPEGASLHRDTAGTLIIDPGRE